MAHLPLFLSPSFLIRFLSLHFSLKALLSLFRDIYMIYIYIYILKGKWRIISIVLMMKDVTTCTRFEGPERLFGGASDSENLSLSLLSFVDLDEEG